MNDYKYMVCTHCNTFNQLPYIKETLNGFIIQNTAYPVVYAICDDCSTDGEKDFLRKWAEDNLLNSEQEIAKHKIECYGELFFGRYKYKRNFYFVILLLNSNLYSQGQHVLKQEYLKEWLMTSKYRAICEGDDYWTDPNKLQSQIHFLENNLQYSAIATNSIKIDENGVEIGLFSQKNTRDLNSLDELVIKRQFHTASILCRNNYFDEQFYKCNCTWDTFMWCWLVNKAPIKYVSNTTCVYRKGGQGVTNTTSRLKWIETNENWSNILFEKFGPDKLSYEGAYISLCRDILSLLVKNKKLSTDERHELKKKYKQYANVSINKKNILFVLNLFRDKLISKIR